MEDNILSLLKKLSDLLYQISLKTKHSKKLREKYENELEDLILESLDTIDQIEIKYSDVIKFKVEDVNNLLKDLTDDISIFFAKEKDVQKSFNNREKELYEVLTFNLSKLSKLTVTFQKSHNIKGLLSLGKASAERGKSLLVESWNKVWKDVQKIS